VSRTELRSGSGWGPTAPLPTTRYFKPGNWILIPCLTLRSSRAKLWLCASRNTQPEASPSTCASPPRCMEEGLTCGIHSRRPGGVLAAWEGGVEVEKITAHGDGGQMQAIPTCTPPRIATAVPFCENSWASHNTHGEHKHVNGRAVGPAFWKCRFWGGSSYRSRCKLRKAPQAPSAGHGLNSMTTHAGPTSKG